MSAYVTHSAYVERKNGRKVVMLSNDDDDSYQQIFRDRNELEMFIADLRAVADEAWGQRTYE
jgi:hypothetical protein